MAVGRAIQLGHLTMEDLEKPVVDFLKKMDRNQLVEGAEQITLAEAMNMHSGIRINKLKAAGLMRNPKVLKGQGQIQAYLTHSQPIPSSPTRLQIPGF